MRKALFCLIILAIVSLPALAQDPVVVSPDYYSVLLENEHVRVVEFDLPPGKSDNMHSHPAALIFYLEDSEVTVNLPDGRTKSAALTKHGVFFQDGATHQVENAGETHVRAVAFELKQPVGAPDTVKLSPATVDPESNTIVFDNHLFRAVYTVTQPGEISNMHEHLAMAVYAATPAKLEITADSGEKRKIDIPAGAAIFSPPVRHTVANIGDEEVILLHVEIK